MKASLFSKLVTGGVVLAAGAGWLGADTVPVDQALAAPAAVVAQASAATTAATQPSARNRAAWQPSPIPAQHQWTAPNQPVTMQTDTPAVSAGRTLELAPVDETAPAVPVVPVVPMVPVVPGAPGISGIGAPQVAAPAGSSLLSRAGEWLAGVFGRTVSPGAGVAVSPASTERVVRFDEVFSHNVLESIFNGELPAVRGEWRHVQMFSRALGEEVTYLAWLPPGYDTARRTYPTLYLLHGVGGDEGFGAEEWLGYALTENLDRMLALKLIEPMIVVVPNGEQGYWMNHANGGPQWADFVAIDLVRHVDATFRTDPARERRAVGGLSMGGHGALQLAYNHPNVFSIAGAHSPTIRTFEDSPEFFGDQRWFARYDPISLAHTGSAAQRVFTWIDVGEVDQWRAGAQVLRDLLVAKRAPVEFRVLEGEHEGWYWEYYLPEYLHFYSNALYATTTTPWGAPLVKSDLITTAGVFSHAFDTAAG